MQRKPVVKCFYIRGCDVTDVEFKTFSLHNSVKTGQNAAKLWHQPLKKGCNRKSSNEKGFYKKSVCEKSISSKEKGWGRQTCHKIEECKSVQNNLRDNAKVVHGEMAW